MNAFRRMAIAFVLLTAAAMITSAQDQAGVTTMAKTKFQALPGLPACMTLSAQRGDPFKGPAVVLIKFTPGCSVPWHWHTAGEGLMIVSGKAKLEMKDASAPAPLAPGDYAYLPGKHQHKFTCISGCTLFDVTEGAFDIHYVDKDGKEIPP